MGTSFFRFIKTGLASIGILAMACAALPSQAALCCKCTKAAHEYCVENITDVANCSDLALSSTELQQIKKGNEILFNGFSCSQDLGPADCNSIDKQGICAVAPVTLQGLLPILKQADQDNEEPARVIQSSPPILGVPIPGLTFGKVTQQGSELVIPYLAQYISAVYKYLMGASVIVAIIMVMYGGFRYLMGSAIGDAKAGKSIIKDAVMGLIILMGAYVVLQTINPATLNLTALRIPLVERVDTEEEADSVDTSAAASAPTENQTCNSPVLACNSADSCDTLCKKPQSDWPTCSPKVADVSTVQLIPTGDGIENPSGKKALPELITALKKAGQDAAGQGYTIRVTSGWRPMSEQMQFACAAINGGHPEKVPSLIAYPGGSNHGSGRAIDIQLWKGTTLVSDSRSATQKSASNVAGSKILLKIMSDAGFKRYQAEIWHFEYGTSEKCRCDINSCPEVATKC